MMGDENEFFVCLYLLFVLYLFILNDRNCKLIRDKRVGQLGEYKAMRFDRIRLYSDHDAYMLRLRAFLVGA